MDLWEHSETLLEPALEANRHHYSTHGVASDIIQLTADIDWDRGSGNGNVARWRFQ